MARKSGAHIPEKNAPLFEVPAEEGMGGITPQEREPLLGPAGSFVGDPASEFGGGTGNGFDGRDAFRANPKHPDAPLNDADFPTDDTFSPGTGGAT